LIDKGTPNVLRKINVEDLVEGVTMPEMPYAKGRIRKGVDVANGLTRRVPTQVSSLLIGGDGTACTRIAKIDRNPKIHHMAAPRNAPQVVEELSRRQAPPRTAA
jgi:hypothetical protein